MGDEYIRNLVITRLSAMPPNISFSIGNFGNFSRDELISNVRKGTEIGKAAIKMQVHFMKASPKIRTAAV